MLEIRRRTRVIGAFPDGESALMLCAARLRHIAGTQRGTRRYLNMEPLFKQRGIGVGDTRRMSHRPKESAKDFYTTEIAAYRKRMQIEEAFHDAKDDR